MKKFLLLLVAMVASLSAWADVTINETNFPDGNFRNWVLSQEFGEDGVLTVDEIAEVTTIDVGFEEIADLTGIGYFYALTELSCPFNELTELDLSQNTCLTFLNCEVNQLTKLDFSHNEQIRWIGFDVNRIKGENMDNLIASLPTVENGSGSLFAINHYSGEQNVITAIQVSAAEAKGWIVMDDNGNVYSGSYTITLPESFENGSVICDKTEAAEGETVTLTVTPNNGYELETLTVTTVDGEPSGAPMLRLRGGSVELTPGENGTYTFEMPAAPVTINATFKETTVTGLIDLDAVQPKSGQRYNMMGQLVGKDYKGIVIEDGVKKIVK